MDERKVGAEPPHPHDTSAHAPTAPTPGLLCSVVTTTWIDVTPAGSVAFLLIAHPPPRRSGESAAALREDMRSLGTALGLVSSRCPLPDIGPRLTLHGGKAAIRVDGCDFLLGTTIGATWSDFVAQGGPVVVSLGLAPLPVGADRDAVEAYIGECLATGELMLGAIMSTAPGRRRASDLLDGG
ncbi:hypothetical protein GCM10009801_21350 [Streptomyces albiaxialis]|uniref:Uncharacterized protein n=1 Tax=Streptomyces albiaxialis TaxID=329523 RepID=A0ABN2VSD4_9ACTN